MVLLMLASPQLYIRFVRLTNVTNTRTIVDIGVDDTDMASSIINNNASLIWCQFIMYQTLS